MACRRSTRPTRNADTGSAGHETEGHAMSTSVHSNRFEDFTPDLALWRVFYGGQSGEAGR
jgi:hypothetical protein